MNIIILETRLESTDLGSNRQELIDYVENHPRWLEFVITENTKGIPTDDGVYPCEDWFNSMDFHPDDLLTEACESLHWNSVPTNGGFLLTYDWT